MMGSTLYKEVERLAICSLCNDVKSVGITDGEIMEVAALHCYSSNKVNVLFNTTALSDPFKVADNVTPHKELLHQR